LGREKIRQALRKVKDIVISFDNATLHSLWPERSGIAYYSAGRENRQCMANGRTKASRYTGKMI
jgi:hypothetical protein